MCDSSYCSKDSFSSNLLQVIEQSGVIEAPGLSYRNIPAVVTTAVGQMVYPMFIFYVSKCFCWPVSSDLAHLKS